ncbi:three-Cys-motif partner protein [Nocardia amikacinitolerans]|uniref:three-Cys-motif partner protein TcmP n=1 Tax=Nocardia amikacinitolerans TaxID=756689 RepID=UPI0020A537F2|nr:three-Cys-motif partner protein TcmP [Nocardia amikacinitolerans]MCP2298530.1 three-Cys-motif partner protein [Nocardia amikacinitolerans]
MSRRGWGPWSRIKLEALEDYLNAFVTASKSAGATLYLDLFAGAANNFERGTGQVILGSGHRALSASPPFTKVVLCELQPKTAANLKATLDAEYPGRDLTVLSGDCNIEIPNYLRTLPYAWRKGAAVFAMVDQFSAEISWETLEYLAGWRKNQRGFKVELWLYFGHGLLPRGLKLQQPEPDPVYAAKVDRMFGSPQWRELWSARHDNQLDPHQFRAELVNLMRWRLQHLLGYTMTIPLEFTNTAGAPIYTVIFATSNDTGSKIMSNVFGKHGIALDNMRRIAKAERKLASEEPGLFGTEEVAAMLAGDTERDTLSPPSEPFRYRP